LKKKRLRKFNQKGGKENRQGNTEIDWRNIAPAIPAIVQEISFGIYRTHLFINIFNCSQSFLVPVEHSFNIYDS